jgi:integrase
MVLLQYWTGARPGEIFALTPKDIDRTRDIWVATVREHKGTWREDAKPRYLTIPKAAQAPLKELISETAPGEPLFQPLRAMKERWEACPTHRKVQAEGTCGHIGGQYDKDSYRRVIRRACEKAGLPVWTPYQLRHTAATEIEAESGGMAAKAMLGHSSLNTTQIYLHADLEAAIEAARNRR